VYKVVVVAGEGKKQNSLSRPPEIFHLLQLVRDEKVHSQLKLLIIFSRIELKYLSFRWGNPEMFTNDKNTVDMDLVYELTRFLTPTLRKRPATIISS
jgi:hypothetical protein